MNPEKSNYFPDRSKAPGFYPADGVRTEIMSGHKGEKIMVVLTTIQPGCSVPEHHHPHEQCGMVQSGRAKMIIGGQEKVVGAGDFCIFPSNVPHAAACEGNEPFVMLDIFHPVRDDFLSQVSV